MELTGVVGWHSDVVSRRIGLYGRSDYPATLIHSTIRFAEPTEQPDPGDTIPDVENDDADTEPQE